MLTNPMGIPGVKWYKAADDGKYLKGRIHFQFNNDFDAFWWRQIIYRLKAFFVRWTNMFAFHAYVSIKDTSTVEV